MARNGKSSLKTVEIAEGRGKKLCQHLIQLFLFKTRYCTKSLSEKSIIRCHESCSRSIYPSTRSDWALLALSEMYQYANIILYCRFFFFFVSDRPISAHFVSIRALREVLDGLN